LSYLGAQKTGGGYELGIICADSAVDSDILIRIQVREVHARQDLQDL